MHGRSHVLRYDVGRSLRQTEKIISFNNDFLHLKPYNNIREGNALRIDWNEVVDVNNLSYIIGNPPFVGARMMTPLQKDDVVAIFGKKWYGVGDLDYVCCWYKKAADLMDKNSKVNAALVSTNSITQGGAVANLWKPLFEENNVHIDFAWRTFRWDSESSLKAHVHCVIVGFSIEDNKKKRILFNERGEKTICDNINGYLLNGKNAFVESRQHPFSDVPEIGIGNKPIDGGNYLFKKEEMEDFIKKEPQSAQYFKLWYGSDEFINRRPRYCLWLGECSPSQLHSMPRCLERVENVRNYRLASPSAPTQKLADKPTRFHVENMPNSNYIIVPKVSSERRRYIPMGLMTPDNFCSDLVFVIPDATLYHFGILTSSVHMAWMRAVCGRLEMRYRYSKDIVYNNFPWPESNDTQKQKIEQTAQAILDARAIYPDSSLADLYDEVTMPGKLHKAHTQNDQAVLAAYGLNPNMPEEEIVAWLMDRYEQLTSPQPGRLHHE